MITVNLLFPASTVIHITLAFLVVVIGVRLVRWVLDILP